MDGLLADDALIDERSLSRLKWRCRRGLLENDLFIERFFRDFENCLTMGQGKALDKLMALSDNDLLDLHLARKSLSEVDPGMDQTDIREILNMLRNKTLKGTL